MNMEVCALKINLKPLKLCGYAVRYKVSSITSGFVQWELILLWIVLLCAIVNVLEYIQTVADA